MNEVDMALPLFRESRFAADAVEKLEELCRTGVHPIGCPADAYRDTVVALARENGALAEAVDRIETRVEEIADEYATMRKCLEDIKAAVAKVETNTTPVTEFWKDVGSLQRAVKWIAAAIVAGVSLVVALNQFLGYIGYHKGP